MYDTKFGFVVPLNATGERQKYFLMASIFAREIEHLFIIGVRERTDQACFIP